MKFGHWSTRNSFRYLRTVSDWDGTAVVSRLTGSGTAFRTAFPESLPENQAQTSLIRRAAVVVVMMSQRVRCEMAAES